jgi:hypothetical protein
VYEVAATPRVGSLLGLKPYSAISLLRSSASFFFAFLLRHRKKPIRNAAAIATIGMTTAIAILADVLRPLLEPDPDPDALSAEALELALEDVDVDVSELVPSVDVTTTTDWVGVTVTLGSV